MLCLHGVFLALSFAPEKDVFYSIGVLLRGAPGIGKGELALELIARGHALVADDSPLFETHTDGQWYGHCPPILQDLLEVRGLGILNIRQLFGHRAICQEHRLDLVITLEPSPTPDPERLRGAWRTFYLGKTRLPELPLPARDGRQLALLVETAARLKACGGPPGFGYNAADELSSRLMAHLEKESP